jgi:hypothetical protein
MHRLPDLELVVAHIVTGGLPVTVSRKYRPARPTYLRTTSGSFAMFDGDAPGLVVAPFRGQYPWPCRV